MSHTGRAFAATRYSVLSLWPAKPIRPSGITVWYAWDDFARKNGILNKNGEPSLSKIKMLIKHKCLSATVSKCIKTFHHYHPTTGEAIYRRQSRIVVTERWPEQMEWEPWRWQVEYKALFSRSQGNKARGKRKR